MDSSIRHISDDRDLQNKKDLNELNQYQIKNYLINAGAHKPGIKTREVIDYYNNWAINYEKDLNFDIYRGPKIAADVCDIFCSNKNVRILDVGAGTGLVGDYLKKNSFENIDGLEPSEAMLEIARSKNIYKKLYQEVVSINKPTSIPDCTYDCLITAGAFGEGHIPAEGIKELARLVKSNGLIIIVMRKEYLYNVKDYANKLETLIKKLETNSVWSRIMRIEVPNYSFNKEGLVFVFRKN